MARAGPIARYRGKNRPKNPIACPQGSQHALNPPASNSAHQPKPLDAHPLRTLPLAKYFKRATIAGIMVSVLVHLVITIIAALITINFGVANAGSDGDAGVEFAVLTQSELASTSSPNIEFESFEVAITPNESVVEIDMLTDSGTDQSVDDLADSIAPSLNPGGGSLTSIDASTGSSGAGTGDGASFFGLEAQGRRFAYIVDISGSMDTLLGDGELSRWDMTRYELMRSVDGLDQVADFYIVLFSGGPISLFGTPEWIQANPTNKSTAGTGLEGITPGGGTKPASSFEDVFALDPRPDAIYFMTDGLVPSDVPDLVLQMNRGHDIPIHCILFGNLQNLNDARNAKLMLRSIAKYSGGKFTHIQGNNP